MTTTPPDLPAGFKVSATIQDAFGTLLISEKGTSFRVFSGTPTRPIPLKQKYLASSGNPSTKQN